MRKILKIHRGEIFIWNKITNDVSAKGIQVTAQYDKSEKNTEIFLYIMKHQRKNENIGNISQQFMNLCLKNLKLPLLLHVAA